MGFFSRLFGSGPPATKAELDKVGDEIVGASQKANFEEVLEKTALMRQGVFAADEISPMDKGEALGLVRFYEQKANYELGNFEAAYAAYRAKEEIPFHLPVGNAAWCASVAAELAARLSLGPDKIVEHGEEAFRLRKEQGDEEGMLLARQTLCAILIEYYPDRVTPFALELFRVAHEADELQFGSRALGMLLRVHGMSVASDTKSALREVRSLMKGMLAAQIEGSGTQQAIEIINEAIGD